MSESTQLIQGGVRSHRRPGRPRGRGRGRSSRSQSGRSRSSERAPSQRGRAVGRGSGRGRGWGRGCHLIPEDDLEQRMANQEQHLQACLQYLLHTVLNLDVQYRICII